jgi:exosortase/archaeosortase family protein
MGSLCDSTGVAAVVVLAAQSPQRGRKGLHGVIAWRCFFPPFAAAFACWPVWPWLWGRWFGTGGEMLQGCLFFGVAGYCFVRLRGTRRQKFSPFLPDAFSLFVAASFLVIARIASPFVPRLLGAGLFFSALYWSLRASFPSEDRKESAALWPLLLLCLPIVPSLQFVFGYPLRASAAWLAAKALPGVRAVGCGLSDGVVEVFVDAPCAGAKMLSQMLLLASGAGLIFRLDWLRTAFLLFTGLLCALWANASRAALLFIGYSGTLPVSFRLDESVTGLSCFAVSALLLTAAAYWIRGRGNFHAARTDFPAARSRKNGRASAAVVFYFVTCVFIAVLGGLPQHRPVVELPPNIPVLWPASWEGRQLIAVPASPETEFFWRDFPGACREFAMQPKDDEGLAAPDRLVLRFVRRATRQLHPAEDCFRGAGYKIKPLPLLNDEKGRGWSGFVAERPERRWTVRQCIVTVRDGDLRRAENTKTERSWPDVSSWYWDAARPGTASSPALAVTVIRNEAL